MKYSFLMPVVVLAGLGAGSCSSDQPDTTAQTLAARPPAATAAPTATRPVLVEAVQLLLSRLDTVQLTGSRDQDFALLMALHHRAALRLARLELELGQDSALLAMARLVRADQQQTGQQLKLATARLDNPGQNYRPRNARDAFARRTAAATDTMLQPIGALRGNIDQDFATLLLAHYRATAVLAQAEMTLGRDAGMRQLAQTLTAAQQSQARQLRRWQATQRAASR